MFIESENIKVYPSTYRTNVANDTNAGFMTEQNLTYLKRLSDNFHSYFKSTLVSGTNYHIDLTLYGYRFVFNLDLTAIESTLSPVENGKIYAYIQLQSIDLSNYETTAGLKPLINDSNMHYILDDGGSPSSPSLFKGLELVNSVPEGNNIYYIELCKAVKVEPVTDPIQYKWEFSSNKNLKLQTNEIANDASGNKNITEQFDTNVANITTENVTTINLNNNTGNIYKNNQSVIIPPYDSNKKNYALSVDDNGELVWRQYYDGSVTITLS